MINKHYVTTFLRLERGFPQIVVTEKLPSESFLMWFLKSKLEKGPQLTEEVQQKLVIDARENDSALVEDEYGNIFILNIQEVIIYSGD